MLLVKALHTLNRQTHVVLGVESSSGIQHKEWWSYRLGDEAEAVRCYQDAHRMFPANMDVISWLGAFHVKNQVSTPLRSTNHALATMRSCYLPWGSNSKEHCIQTGMSSSAQLGMC